MGNNNSDGKDQLLSSPFIRIHQAKYTTSSTDACKTGVFRYYYFRPVLLYIHTHSFRGCKETRRAKAKVWNTRDLDRARSIPPPVPPTITGENGNRNKTSAAIKRLSDAGTARRLSSGSSKTNLLKNSDPPKGREEGGGNKREGSEVGGGAVDDGKAELERRREERAAQALEK